MPLSLSVVTAERTVLQRDDVQRLIVPTIEGQITILPSHAALMSSLGYGEMLAVCPGETVAMAVFGGFLQVVKDQVTILADAAERAEEINEDRAEEARERAQQRLGQHAGPEAVDHLRAQLSLQRALIRQRVRRRSRSATGAPTLSER